MRLFRSGEHVMRAYPEPGAVFRLEQLWRLAQGWYGDRLRADWVPASRQRAQAILAGVGLAGEFWGL
jgi:hypothetical protein